MILKIESGLIVGFATIGGIDGGKKHDGVVPDDFIDNFNPGRYKLADETIIDNPDYQEATVEVSSVPTEQDKINAQLLKSAAQNSAANAAIVKQLANTTSAGQDMEEAK